MVDYPTDLSPKQKGYDYGETTELVLYDIAPFNPSHDNVIYFDNDQQQRDFFSSNKVHVLKRYTDFQFVEKTGEIFIEAKADYLDSQTASYMRFKNPQFSRDMYAFVFDVVKTNNNTLKIVYELDVFNTYQHLLRPTSGTKMHAVVEQNTKPEFIDSLSDASLGLTQSKRTAYLKGLGVDQVEWLVIVTKPEFSLPGMSAKNPTFTGTQKQFCYFLVPINANANVTLPFTFNGQTGISFNLNVLFSYLSGKSSSGDNNAVNNIVNMYYTRWCGVEYDFDGTTVTLKGDVRGEVINLGGQRATNPNPGGSGGNPTAGVNIKPGDYEYDQNSQDSRVRAIARIIADSVSGATAEGIAGIIGNFSQESSVNPARYECDWLNGYQFDKANSGGITAENLFGSWGAFQSLYSIGLNQSAYQAGGQHWIGAGLGQWTGPRSKALYDYAKSTNRSVWDLNTQIKFALEGDDAGRRGQFVTAATYKGSTAASTQYFLLNWEGINNGTLGARQAEAAKWLHVVQEEMTKPSIKKKS